MLLPLSQEYDLFIEQTKYLPLIGAELEFYIPKYEDDAKNMQFLQDILADEMEIIENIEHEKCFQQFEIAFKHGADILALADNIERIKEKIGREYMRPKPFADRYGCAFQVRINLFDEQGRVVFKKIDADEYCDELLFAIGGLCVNMKERMGIFAPDEESRLRYVPKQLAPTTVSWGGNNRTCALRLSVDDPDDVKIEHRVPANNADSHAVIGCILHDCRQGLLQRILWGEKIWGDASDEKYGLERLI